MVVFEEEGSIEGNGVLRSNKRLDDCGGVSQLSSSGYYGVSGYPFRVRLR
jgi:hypothetical protein